MTLRRMITGRVCGGSSMAPTIQPGDRVTLADDGSRVRPGDAILFSGADGDYDILHRFLFKVPCLPFFVHRGDAVGARVGLARCDRILGVAVTERRKPSFREMFDGGSLVARYALSTLARGLHLRRRHTRA